MIKQLPAERPLPQKEEILGRVLAEGAATGRKRRWLVPVAAAASIAVIAGGLLTVPALVRSDDNGTNPAGRTSQGTPSTPPKTTQTNGSGVSIDRGKLTDAEATAFGTACAKGIGAQDRPGQDSPDWPGAGAKVEKILHATKIVGRFPNSSTDWTVAVKSGGHTYACVGRITKKGPDGQLMRGYDFGAFSSRYPDGVSGSGDGSGMISKTNGTGTAKVTSYRWIVVPATTTQVQRRIVMNGKPSAWFSSDVVDGLVFIHASAEARLVPGSKVRIETRLLNDAGKQVGSLLVQASTVVPIVGGSGGISLQPDSFPR
jgi:hypothetical protein